MAINIADIEKNGQRLGEPSGFAVVYKYALPSPMFDLTQGSIVAVKVYHDWVAIDAEEVKRFEDEFRLGYQINHSNVVRLLAFGRDDAAKKYYSVMHYIEGITLKTWRLNSGADITDSIVISLLSQILSGLEEIHRQGIVHRDLKPANIMLENRHGNLVPVILDLGLAANLTEDSRTRTGAVLASTRYCAPEYLQPDRHRRDYDKRIDLYSLGAVLFFLRHGVDPYADHSDALSIARASLEMYPAAINKPVTALSHWWDGIAYGLMCKDRERRTGVKEVRWILSHLSRGLMPPLEQWTFRSVAKDYFHSVLCRLIDVPRPDDSVWLRAPAKWRPIGRHLDTQKIVDCRSDGVLMRALYQHPYYSNPTADEARAGIQYVLPETVSRFVLEGISQAAFLEFFTGIRDGGNARTKDTPIRFAVLINGVKEFDELRWGSGWQRHLLPIPPHTRHSILQIDLITQAYKTPDSAWAAWGEPQLIGIQPQLDRPEHVVDILPSSNISNIEYSKPK